MSHDWSLSVSSSSEVADLEQLFEGVGAIAIEV